MNGQHTKKLAIDFLFVLNAAITNIRLYPPTSGIILKSVERMQKALEDALASVSALEYAESEKNLLVMGEPLPEKEQQKPQVRSFLTLMLDLGVKSMTFQEGIDRKEIVSFLQVISKSPEAVDEAGGLEKLLADSHITHIAIDEKVYIERDSGQSILAELDISNETFARYLLGEETVSPDVIEQVREMVSDPEVFAGIFEAGVQELLKKSEDLSPQAVSGKFDSIMDVLGRVSELERREIGRMIVDAMPEMDDGVLAGLLAEDLDEVLGSGVFDEHVRHIQNEQFTRLFERLRAVAETAGQQYGKEKAEAIRQVLERVQQAGKDRGPASEPAPTEKSDSAQRLQNLKKAFGRIMKGDREPLSDPAVAAALPNAVSQLIEKGKQDTAEAMIDRLGEALSDQSPEIRKIVAGIMADIDTRMDAEKQIEQRINLSRKLAEWVKAETVISEEYRSVTEQLENLAQKLIQQDRTADAAHILEAYHLIHSGGLEKDEAIAALAGNMLQNLSTDYILDVLLQDSEKEVRPAGANDIYSLVILGTTTVERLLDRLHDSHNMSERNRIIQAVTQMGHRAVPSIVERLGQEGPWYYIRNLALLLGRLGDERHLTILEPLLRHSDYRVQREAIKSIQAVGNEKAGQPLLKNLDDLDPQLLSYAISVLGALKYEPAAAYLIDVVKSRQISISKAEREEIREKACEALGRIKAQEAIAPLEQLVRAKGFFRSPPEKVRSAAAKALANIKRG